MRTMRDMWTPEINKAEVKSGNQLMLLDIIFDILSC